MRKGYSDSWPVFANGRGELTAPPLLGRRPAFGEVEGIDLFRTRVEEEDYAGLTLPHLYVCRTLIRKCSFRDSDVSQSLLVWSDFENVTFVEADLHDGDLRNSIFDGCQFDGANLEGCDVRGSTFRGCTFFGARTMGMVITQKLARTLPLLPEQLAASLVGPKQDSPGG